jgi:phage terminase Nu1 subunit (DNA packaging protein)
MPPKQLTVRELAGLYGVTPQAIRLQLVGLEPDSKEGRKAARYCVRRYGEHVFGSRGGERGSLEDERTRLTAAQADKQEMDNALRRGELAPMEWYEERLGHYVRQLASLLDALPLRLRQLLPHLSQIDHVRIEQQLASDRQRLSDRLAGGDGASEAGGSEGSGNAAGAAGAAAE